MWWAVTESLYVGGAGAAIIGGLYWKKGTTAGAWAGLLTGSILVTGGILARRSGDTLFRSTACRYHSRIDLGLPRLCGVSLLTCREDFNMDRMLHRGAYAVKSERQFETESKKRVTWGRLIGLDEHFTIGDKLLAGGLFGWSMFWFSVFVVGTIWNLISPWPITVWANYWLMGGICIPIFFAVLNSVWVLMGRHSRHAPVLPQTEG